jgi:parvulin-like peptidyl-prolyl isomerase
LISANPCSRCGGEVQRNKKKFVIRCDKCNYEHSYLHYPDLVDASFQQELERLELEQKQREIERRLEEDRQAEGLAEHQLRLRSNETWREEIRSAVNDVDVEVRKVLNRSPGDIVDEVALRHVFKAAEKSLEVTDSRLEQRAEFTNYLAAQKRVLEDLMTAIKSQTGLNLSGMNPATIENSGA